MNKVVLAFCCACLGLLPPVVASPWSEFFPDGLINAKGEPVAPASLDGKIVCLYFSASWCGPCRGFTPKLIDFYKRYAPDIEIVLVSKDRNRKAFLNYMAEYPMPWLAVDWADSKVDGNLPRELIKKYHAGGIPKLVVLSRDGNSVVEANARMQVAILPEDYAEKLRNSDPKQSAQRWRKREEAKGKTISDEAYTLHVGHIKERYLKMAETYDAAAKASLREVHLGENPEWLDLVHDYYRQLRAEAGEN
ncbi:thioredoxin-like domain-containing protein [Coraliomargarita parva]|uniref:thioredoxin-like domain-containing protein n=1 Tax=Coraliomargarita parva TaxID=3014050 RepID=UPI0022B58808|nr:thioredoxin-like domain-containing protein [Coraliomargarita parva]